MASTEDVWKKLTGVMIGCLFLHLGIARQTDQNKSLFDLMNYQEVLPITINIDLDTIKAYRNKRDQIKTTIHFNDEKGKLLSWDAEVEIRGKFRRNYCAIPPVKLNFKKSQLADAGLNTFDDFDIVTHCLNNPDIAKELVIKEYLAYKLYNEVSDYSYRVLLIQITFKNVQTNKEDILWGFLIEDTAELAARIGAAKLDTMILAINDFEEEKFNSLYLFQSMIGNVDWGLKPVKNIRIFRKEGTLIPVPYDFDFSILVAAPYAKTSINSVMRSKTQLQLLDEPLSNEGMIGVLNLFQAKKNSFLDAVQNITLLSDSSREKIIQLLDCYLENPFKMAIPLPLNAPTGKWSEN